MPDSWFILESWFIPTGLLCLAIALGMCVYGVQRGIKDPLHPLYVSAFYTPGLAGIYFCSVGLGIIENPSIRLLYPYFYVHSIENALPKVALLMVIGNLGYLAGFHWLPIHRNAQLKTVAVDRREASLLLVGLLLIGVGLASFTYYVLDTGGLLNLVQNLQMRSKMSEGRGLAFSLSVLPLQMGTLLIFLDTVRDRKGLKLPFLIGVILLDVAVFSLLGGRALLLRLFVMAVLAFHFRVRRLSMPDLKRFAIVLPLLLVYFAALRVIRTSQGGFAEATKDPETMVQEIGSSFVNTLGELSYAPTYTVIADGYTLESFKMGSSFKDLAVAFIPRKFYGADKPPGDDGIYVAHLTRFLEHKPPGTAAKEMFMSSFPPETLGNGFINFGFPGAFLFMAALAWCHKVLYQWAKNSRYSVVACIFLTVGTFQFHLTNLRMMSLGIAIFGLGVLLLPLTRWVRLDQLEAEEADGGSEASRPDAGSAPQGGPALGEPSPG